MTSPAPLVRPVALTDHDAVDAMLDKAWFARRSRAGSAWLIEANPGQSGLPAGWVLERADGALTGFIGNFVQRVWRQGRSDLVATAHSFVAAPGEGARSLVLLRGLIHQPGVLLRIGLSANKLGARVYSRMKLHVYRPAPVSRLAWMIDPLRASACGVMRRAHMATGYRLARHLPEIPHALPPPADLLARLPDGVRCIADPLADRALATFDAALREGDRLFAERSPEALHWRLTDPDFAGSLFLLGFERGGGLDGLCLVQFNKPSEIEPPMLDIIDLVTRERTDSHAIQTLVRAARTLARSGGAAWLRLNFVSQELGVALGQVADTARDIGDDLPALVSPSPQAETPLEPYWQPTPFDADFGLCLRPLSRRPAAR